MISCKLNGGLGNKLFQVAATYALAMDNNDTCAFDLNDHVSGQGFSSMVYRENVLKDIDELPYEWEPKFTYKQTGQTYYPIPYYENMILEGYFQSEKYFQDHRKDIVKLFKDKEIIKSLKSKYTFKDSLSIHVRRGDYLGVSDCRPLPVNYYNEALQDMNCWFNIKNIYIFSDDMDWCRDNFEDKRMIYMFENPDYLDLYMMSLCPYNILANSSFSWWGNYLNENYKYAIAPEQWRHELGTSDIYRDKWLVL